VILVVAVVLLLSPATASWAEIYRWIDERGAANYSEGLDSVPQKYRASAVPVGLKNAPAAPAAAPGAGEPGKPGAAGGPKGTGGAEVKFTPGKAVVVDVLLNGRTTTKLILDTGADLSVVNPRVLTAAGVSLTEGQRSQIRGATGTASVQTVQVDSVAVGTAQVSKLPVISHDIEQDGVDGLLGRNFLDQFKVSIDNQAGVVTLSPK
jgi:predicted aspartyl protease